MLSYTIAAPRVPPPKGMSSGHPGISADKVMRHHLDLACPQTPCPSMIPGDSDSSRLGSMPGRWSNTTAPHGEGSSYPAPERIYQEPRLILCTAAITVTATDEDGLTASQTFTVTVNPAPTPEPAEQTPVAVSTISNITLTVGATPATVDVAGYFRDPDDQTLTYTTRSSAPAIATAAASGSTVTVTAVAEWHRRHHRYRYRRGRP